MHGTWAPMSQRPPRRCAKGERLGPVGLPLGGRPAGRRRWPAVLGRDGTSPLAERTQSGATGGINHSRSQAVDGPAHEARNHPSRALSEMRPGSSTFSCTDVDIPASTCILLRFPASWSESTSFVIHRRDVSCLFRRHLHSHAFTCVFATRTPLTTCTDMHLQYTCVFVYSSCILMRFAR